MSCIWQGETIQVGALIDQLNIPPRQKKVTFCTHENAGSTPVQQTKRRLRIASPEEEISEGGLINICEENGSSGALDPGLHHAIVYMGSQVRRTLDAALDGHREEIRRQGAVIMEQSDTIASLVSRLDALVSRLDALETDSFLGF